MIQLRGYGTWSSIYDRGVDMWIETSPTANTKLYGPYYYRNASYYQGQGHRRYVVALPSNWMFLPCR